ncbi:hypothetical protein CL628_03280 [bacterium]|nr:hypothetical protein [bacterium]
MADPTLDALFALLVEQKVSDENIASLKKVVADGGDLYEEIVSKKILPEETLAQAWATALQIPYVDLHGVDIAREVLQIIPESTAREHSIIAYQHATDQVQVAMADPRDRQIVEFIQKKVDKPVTIAQTSRASIREGLALYQESLDTELQQILSTVGAVAVSGDDLSKAAEDLPVVRTVDLLLKHAILQDASDIHIEPTETTVVIRYRVDGILHDMLTLPRDFLAGLIARIKVLSNLKIDEHRLPQDGRFKIETEDYKIAFRVSILPVYDGEKVVMRLLDESGKGLDLSSIGLRSTALEVMRRNISKPHGMVLVTGPTGSGKTTTLYAALKELNTPEVNISTVEDPIEYRMPRINQTQVNPKIGLTFSNGLRSLVRQDPDILMVGEIRDEETAALAVNAALTGHLVLSTLHTNSAAGALPRLLDMEVEAFLLASTVNVLVAQRLVRRLCEECHEMTAIGADMIKDLEHVVDASQLTALLEKEDLLKKGESLSKLKVGTPGSCSVCNDGYKGRMGIYEVIEFSDELRPAITSTISSQELERLAREQQDMTSMVEDGLIKVAQGLTSVEEVLRVAKE